MTAERSAYARARRAATGGAACELWGLCARPLAIEIGEGVNATRITAPGNGQPFGGIKVETEMGWFAARPSGTEDVYKVYAESFRDQSHLNRIQNEAQDAIAQIF
jgi:phosphoglucomutase